MLPAMAALAASTLVSEDLACIGAGVLVAQGRLGFAEAVAACCMGILAGDVLLYALGRAAGPRLLRFGWFNRLVPPSELRRARDWLNRQGLSAVFLTRFTPGLRFPAYLAAGIIAAGFWRFLAWLCLAVAVWTPLLVGASVLLGKEIAERLLDGAGAGIIAVVVTAALLFLLRSFAVSKYARWEFWPPWLVYLPSAPWILYLALKHRSLTMCLAANPGMPMSGLVGESKSMILAHLSSAEGTVADYAVIPARLSWEERCASGLAWMKERRLEYPIVLKPDVGERGNGVAIIREEEALRNYLRTAVRDTILQRFVDGPEFGVYYYRRPGVSHGRVLSVTRKLLPEVVGDGRATLRELIQADARSRRLAAVYEMRALRPLDSVPPAGEVVKLSEVGAHCKGAVFLNGASLITPELERAVDAIAKTHPGFHLGRLDIKAPSEEALRRGEGLQVIELNGLTAEPAHIYDPAVSILEAYRALFTHWRLAYEAGSANDAAGFPAPRLLDALQALRRHWMPDHR